MRKWDRGAGSGAKGPADEPQPVRDLADAADAADVEALLLALSELRLSLSADLSAAAGALDAERPDVAADVISGARRDVTHLRSAAKRRSLSPPSRALVSAGVGAGAAAPFALHSSPADDPAKPERRRSWRGHHAGRVLVGAAALALAVVVGPQLGGGSSKPAPAAAPAAVAPALNFHLVSAEFAQLRSALTATKPTASDILSAGQRWQNLLTRGLPIAASHVSVAQQVVSQLRQERTLLVAAPVQHSQPMREATATLINGADTLLAELRGLANIKVLAVLPGEITALPSARPHRATPKPHTSTPKKPTTHKPATGTTAPPTTQRGGSTTVPAPAPAPTPPSVPTLPIPVPSLPLPNPSVPLPTSSGQVNQVPLPSVLNHVVNGLTSGLTKGLSGH